MLKQNSNLFTAATFALAFFMNTGCSKNSIENEMATPNELASETSALEATSNACGLLSQDGIPDLNGTIKVLYSYNNKLQVTQKKFVFQKNDSLVKPTESASYGVINYVYDNIGNLVGENHFIDETSGIIGEKYEYSGRGSLLLPKYFKHYVNNVLADTGNFEYDVAGRLVKINNKTDNNLTETFTYNLQGNLTKNAKGPATYSGEQFSYLIQFTSYDNTPNYNAIPVLKFINKQFSRNNSKGYKNRITFGLGNGFYQTFNVVGESTNTYNRLGLVNKVSRNEVITIDTNLPPGSGGPVNGSSFPMSLFFDVKYNCIP
jgi:hypothetical protein